VSEIAVRLQHDAMRRPRLFAWLLAALIVRPESIPPEYWALSAAISSRLQELGDAASP
jgi:hypothetical protein